MFRTKNHVVSAVSLLIGLAVSGQAIASNGFFAIGQGTKSKGMGGVGIALPQDTLASAANPAGMVFLGDRFDVGVGAFKSQTEETDVQGGTVVFQAELVDQWQYIPHLGYNGMLDVFSSIGVSLYAEDGFDGVSFITPSTALALQQGYANFSYAHKIGEKSSLGGSILVAIQSMAADNGVSSTDELATGFGLKLGWQGDVGGGVSLGATWQPRIQMSKLVDFTAATGFNGALDVPSTYGAGIAWKNNGFTLAFDYQRISYDGGAALGNAIRSEEHTSELQS